MSEFSLPKIKFFILDIFKFFVPFWKFLKKFGTEKIKPYFVK